LKSKKTAHRESSAWVVLTNERGQVIGSARAISDTAKSAWFYDVVVANEQRKRGLGSALVSMLLHHPKVRRVKKVFLGTRDADSLYLRHGFRYRNQVPNTFGT
jgi:N-acetylglutamate synthase-like GNAT family acetyltransferase